MGVSREKNVPYLYRMRSRRYDAMIGRFISYDPLGYRTLETNLYLYAYNNPMVLQYPQGRFPLALIGIGAGIGAVGSLGSYLIGQWAVGEKPTLGGAASAVLTGAVVGATGAGAAVLGLPAAVGAYFVAKHAFFAGLAGYAIKQAIDGKPFKGNDMIKEAANGAATAWLPIKLPIRRLPKLVKDLVNSVFGGTVTNIATNLKKVWENAKKQWEKVKDKFKQWYRDVMDWIESHDPNDILGPDGYGDARFIAGETTLNYKIRFENDPNATAPAQRVFIRYKLDSDLDVRSFRIGSFGFGSFIKTLQTSSPFLQEKLDFVKDRNLYVRVIAGIDIVQNEATWDLQSLDPKTGEPPRDPRRGFLPPNNGTTGQGYVTFSIRAKKDVKPLTRLDAAASIIFDVNEPIDTPSIFNTIDNSGPRTNLTVLQDVLHTGSLAVMVKKHDIGTGVQSVDIYYQEQQAVPRSLGARPAPSDFKLLLQDVSEDIAVLPLKPGRSYKLATAAVDHVGNLQEVQSQRAIFVDFPEIKGSCLHLKNCSNRGNCSMFNLCVCKEGFYGVDCSQDQPPLEPPLLEASSSVGTEDTPVAVLLSARLVGENVTNNTSLTITIYGFPASFTFSRGMRNRDRVVIRREEFGNMFVNPARDYSGNVTLTIVTEVVRGAQKSFTNSSLTLTINAKADLPNLVTKDTCADSKGALPLSINCSLQDRDGSERLTISLSGLPTGYQLSPPGREENGIHYLKPESLSKLVVRYEGNFERFRLKVEATSVETSNGDKATQVKFINVTACTPEFTCSGVKNCSGHGTCIGNDKCKCDKEFTGSDCSEGIDSNTEQNKANIAAIFGGTVGGLVFVVLAVVLIVCLVKVHRKRQQSSQ